MNAGDLVRDGHCTGACLVAAEGPGIACQCRCGGAYHAALACEMVWTQPPGRHRENPYQKHLKEFAHGELVFLPSYAPLRRAISDFLNEADREGLELDFAYLQQAMTDCYMSAIYADRCPGCEALLFPYRVSLVEWRTGWIECTYLCSHCGDRTHTCGWSLHVNELTL